jgi:hypothetical protein
MPVLIMLVVSVSVRLLFAVIITASEGTVMGTTLFIHTKKLT